MRETFFFFFFHPFATDILYGPRIGAVRLRTDRVRRMKCVRATSKTAAVTCFGAYVYGSVFETTRVDSRRAIREKKNISKTARVGRPKYRRADNGVCDIVLRSRPVGGGRGSFFLFILIKI